MSGRKFGAAASGARALKTRTKTARKRSLSSRLWLQRQLNDPYVTNAKKAGLRSRAAYKLAQIDDKYRLFRPGQRIVDLGAAPGGWSQIAAARVQAALGKGRVIGVDLKPIEPIAGVELVIVDVLESQAAETVKILLDGVADGVICDMAANATGHRKTDHLKSMALVETAVEFAVEILRPGGFFLAKVLQGGTEAETLAGLKRSFATVRHVKPAASRTDSAELYVLALGYRQR
jgi:23S rRNA (uridine2552-2'-O)-methyltransferase